MVVAKHTVRTLKSPAQTAREMVRLVESYSSDIGPKKNWSLKKYFNFVKRLPFRPDPIGHEMVSRPKLTLDKNYPWRDCDDKSILIASYLFQNGIPFKFQASSKREDGTLHHVYVIAKINGKETVLDATYPHHKMGRFVDGITKKSDLTGEIMNPTLHTMEGEPLLGIHQSKRKRSFYRRRTIPKGCMSASRFMRKNAQLKLSRPHTLSGDELGVLLGASFLSRMARRTKNISRQTANVIKENPALASVVNTVVPGLESHLRTVSSYAAKAQGVASGVSPAQDPARAAAIASARARAASMALAAKRGREAGLAERRASQAKRQAIQDQIAAGIAAGKTQESFWKDPKVLVGGGVAAVALVALVLKSGK